MTTTREAALEAALKLARNRLQACAIDHPTGSREMAERSEWADEATAALSTPATEPQGYVKGLAGQDINDAICDALGDAMDCTRVWDAWHYGTMSDEDFVLVRDDAARVEEIVAAINSALAAHPAPHPAAEPVGWVIANGADNRWRCTYEWESNSEWTDDKAKALKFATREDAERFSKDDEDAWLVYQVGLPQPAADTRVVVKPLVWERLGNSYRSPGLLFGYIRIENYGNGFEVLWSAPGICDTLVAGNFATIELAQAAAQADYETRILSAIIGTATPAQTYQSRVKPWLDACFGPEIAGDKTERNYRFLEEALELVQSGGCTASEAHQLVDYVYGRPVGEMGQEIGGVMNTLAALCLANGFDMHDAGEVELARVWTKVEKIRAKQAAKPKHSPLPEHPATPAQPDKIAEAARVLFDVIAAEYDGADPINICGKWAWGRVRALAGKGE